LQTSSKAGVGSFPEWAERRALQAQEANMPAAMRIQQQMAEGEGQPKRPGRWRR